MADSANVGVTGRRSRAVRRDRPPAGSSRSSLEDNEEERWRTAQDPYRHLRHRSRTAPAGIHGDVDIEMSHIGASHHDQAIEYPSLSSTGFNAGAIISVSAEEHREILEGNTNSREVSTDTTNPNGNQRGKKRRARNKEWLAEPDVDAHKAVSEWNGTISDLVRWSAAHLAASTTAFHRRNWRRWSRKRWSVFAGIVLVVISGIVGGIFGGLDIANKSGPPKLRMVGPDGSRVVVPWESSAALAFDPMKVCCSHPSKRGL